MTQCVAMPLFPRRPSALVRRCCAADRRDTRHDSCRLYATFLHVVVERFERTCHHHHRARIACVLKVQQCAPVSRVSSPAPDLHRSPPAVNSSCRRQIPAVLGITAMKSGCSVLLSALFLVLGWNCVTVGHNTLLLALRFLNIIIPVHLVCRRHIA